MSTRSFSAPFTVLCGLAACLFTSSSRAESSGHAAVDLDLGASMRRGVTIGAGARFGWRFDFGPVWLQPEVAGHYTHLPRYECPLCEPRPTSIHAARILGGVRLGGSGLISKAIEPAIFGHAGYGWLKFAHAGQPGDTAGPAFDVGFALDVKIVRHFRFGAHAAYNVIKPLYPSEYLGFRVLSEKWINFGLHADAAF